MSASGKLKAMELGYFDLGGHAAYRAEAIDDEGFESCYRFQGALVAVVEAAEGCTDWHRPEGNFIRLSSAIAALDEALS